MEPSFFANGMKGINVLTMGLINIPNTAWIDVALRTVDIISGFAAIEQLSG